MMIFSKKNLLIGILNIIFLINAYSQQSNTVSGRVFDGHTGEILIGATIQIANSLKGTITDTEGRFSLSGIKEQEIEITISYMGYTSKTIPCDFGNRSNINQTVRLIPSSTELDEVKVEGQATGQVKALLDQKTAENIKNIVSEEQIEEFPDMNAAEVLQRIPGITVQRDQGEGRYVQLRGTPPELTNFNINGEQIPSPEGGVRYVGLDVISADQIESIEVTKVLTPDMDADGIGGTVNIITKTASEGKPEIKISGAGGYNNLRGTSNSQLQFSYGQRSNKLGFQLNANNSVNNQGSDNMEFKYEKAPFWGSTSEGIENYHIQYREVQLRHYDITRKRTGLSATLDYQFNEKSSVYLRTMFNSFSDEETRRRYIYELDDAITETHYLYGGVVRDLKYRTKLQEISTINIGGDHDLGPIKIDYEVAYAIATEGEPNRVEFEFQDPGPAINMEFDLSESDWPRLMLPNAADTIFTKDYDNYKFENLLLVESKIRDRNFTAKMNIEIPYTLGSQNGFFKFGAKARLKEKTREINAREYGAYRTSSPLYADAAPELSMAELSDGFSDSNLLNRSYVIDNMPGVDEMLEFYNTNQPYFRYDRTSTMVRSNGEDYTANEDIYAAYGMFRHDINRLMVLGGVRYERTDINYDGMRIYYNSAGYYDSLSTLSDKRSHEFLLPQLQLKYKLNQKVNLRTAITYTYARPNFEDVLPYRAEDRKEVKHGNPDLKFPKSVNIDLLGEKYLIGGGILSGGFFYKNIQDFVFYYRRFGYEGNPQDYSRVLIEKALNGNKASVYGAELTSQFKFYFIPGFFGNFGIYVNYTYTHSEAIINKRFPANEIQQELIFGEDDSGAFGSETEEEKISLPGQAKHSGNFALFFDSDKFYVKITANYHDAFLHKLGADADLDEYYADAWHLDFTARYAIRDNIKFFTDVINLTNSPLKFYIGSPDRIFKQEYYSWWGRLGLKFYF